MKDGQMSSFAKRLDYLISHSEKSASAIAQDLQVSKQTISSWQTGARKPKYPTIMTIAQYFSVDPEWLLGFGEEESYGKNMDMNDIRLFFGAHKDKKFEPGRLAHVLWQSNYDLDDLIKYCHFIPAEDIRAIYEGRQEPSDGQILAFSTVLRVDSAFLFGIADDPSYYDNDSDSEGLNNSSEWAKELVDKYAAAPELIQQVICDILRIKPYIVNPTEAN
jgi:transcriptional regulator with XRE-family HTH domain